MIVSPAAISIPEATSPVASMLRQMHAARTYWPAALYRSKFALAPKSTAIMERPRPQATIHDHGGSRTLGHRESAVIMKEIRLGGIRRRGRPG